MPRFIQTLHSGDKGSTQNRITDGNSWNCWCIWSGSGGLAGVLWAARTVFSGKWCQRPCPILLSMCGAATHQLIRNLVALGKPSDKLFKKIVQLMQDHHNPPPSVTVQWHKFHSCSQKDGESIAEFVAELRHLSEHCSFDMTLDHMLCDRLVCGVRDACIQRCLLAEPDLTFKKAFELAQAEEAADRNAKDIQLPPQHQSLHNIQKSPLTKLPSNSPRTCYRCGGACSCFWHLPI